MHVTLAPLRDARTGGRETLRFEMKIPLDGGRTAVEG
jgi:hypothetical protein